MRWLGRFVCIYSPHKSALALPLVYARPTMKHNVLQLKVWLPLGGIEALASRLGAFGSPCKAEVARRCLGHGKSVAEVGVLPSAAWRYELLYLGECFAVVACKHRHSKRLHVSYRWRYFYAAHRKCLFVFELNIAASGGAECSVVKRYACRVCLLAWHGIEQFSLNNRNGKNLYIFVISFVALWLRQSYLLYGFLAATNNSIGRYNLLHTLLGLYPRAAGKGESVAYMNAEL